MENQFELTKEGLEARRKYHREWRARNKDKVREYNKRFYENKARKEAAQ